MDAGVTTRVRRLTETLESSSWIDEADLARLLPSQKRSTLCLAPARLVVLGANPRLEVPLRRQAAR